MNVLPRRLCARPPSVAGGDYACSPDLKHLTPRMVQIAEQILAGNSTTKGVAEALGIAPQTVKNILHVIYARLGVENRIGLIIKYREGKDRDGEPLVLAGKKQAKEKRGLIEMTP